MLMEHPLIKILSGEKKLLETSSFLCKLKALNRFEIIVLEKQIVKNIQNSVIYGVWPRIEFELKMCKNGAQK